MALVSALWSLALLSSIALSLLFAGNVSYKLAHNNVLAAQEETVTEAAINRAVLALLDPRADKRWPADGVSQDFSFDGTRVRIRIQDELGRIDYLLDELRKLRDRGMVATLRLWPDGVRQVGRECRKIALG